MCGNRIKRQKPWMHSAKTGQISERGGVRGWGGGGGGVERGRSMPPPVEPCGQSSEQSTATKSHTGSCNTSIEEPASL